MADGIWNSQLRIAAGYAVDDAPQLAFAERTDARGRLVSLYILAEPVAAGSDAFIDSFVARIGDLFDPAARSLTGALKLAVETAHEELRVWNREHLPAEQAAYGVSCLILRDGSGILGQAGPSLAFAAGDPGEAGSRFTQLHVHRGEDPVAAPIGGSQPLAVQFAALPQARAGWALLLTTNAGQLLDAERRVALGRLPADEVLRNLYPSLAPLYDVAGLIVALADGTFVPPPPPSQPSSQPPPPLTSQSSPPPPAAADPDPPAEARFALGDADGDQPAQAPGTAANPPETSAPAEPEAPLQTRPPTQPASEFRRELHLPSFSLGSDIAGVAWPRNPFAVQDMQVLTVGVGPARPLLQRSIMELGDSIPSLGGEPVTAQSQPAIVRRGEPRGSNRRVVFALIGMLLVFAAVAAALLGPPLLRTEQDGYTSLLEQARTALAASKLAVGAEAARPPLDDAAEYVSAALELNPLGEEALALRAEIESALDQLKLVYAPGELLTLVDLGRYGPSIALGTLRAAGGRVFALDDAGGRVFAVSEDGVATVIYLEGSVLGAGAELRAGRPLSIAVESLDDGTALWILDANARLYRWTETGTLLVPLPGASRFGSMEAIAVGPGGLYLLDATGGAVWRFDYDGRSLAEPVRAVGRTDLHQAHELAVSATDRGEVEVLIAGADGRLRRFVDGDEQVVALTLDRELLAPASLTTGAQSGLLYAADRGGGRVIVLRPEVGLVAQIESAELREVRGVAVDEATGRIVYALPSSLLLGPLLGSAQ